MMRTKLLVWLGLRSGRADGRIYLGWNSRQNGKTILPEQKKKNNYIIPACFVN